MAPALLRTVAACVAALICGVALGCGEHDPGVDEPAREGLAIDVGGVDYNVFITRELNLAITPDKDYYEGPPAPPGKALYGVFIEACNPGPRPCGARGTSRSRTTRAPSTSPCALPADNAFAYRPTELAEGACMPEDGSVAQQGPTAGSMLLFEFPLENTENRPWSWRSAARSTCWSRTEEVKTVELDL